MKKFVLMLGLVLIVTLSSCASQEKSKDDNDLKNSVDVTETLNDSVSAESFKNSDITMESLRVANETPSEEFECESIDGGVSIVKYIGKNNIVVVPETINGNLVLKIGELAFAMNENIEAVRISSSIETIEDSAFRLCPNLKMFIAGKSLKTIGEYAFNHSEHLSEVELNEGLQEIKYGCFFATDIKELYIPASVTKIDALTFDQMVIVSEKDSEAEKYANIAGLEFRIK